MREHPFDRLMRGRAEQFREMEEERYEASRVEFILGRCGIPKVKYDLMRECERETGQSALRLRYFNARFPTFPILLGATRLDGVKLHADSRAFLPALFTNFRKAPFVEAYLRFHSEVSVSADGRTVGLAFPRKGLKQGLIIHNGGLDGIWVRGTLLTYTGGTPGETERLYVQAFQPLIEAVYNKGHGWDPDS